MENLRRQGYEAFCPTYVKPAPKKSDPGRELALFPAYIFVQLTDGGVWTSVNSTYGVVRLLTDRNRLSPRPLYVSDELVQSLQRLQTLFHRVPNGTRVRVRRRDSPLYDQVGTVVSMGREQRVNVLMSMFSRDVVVEFDVDSLDAEAEEVFLA